MKYVVRACKGDFNRIYSNYDWTLTEAEDYAKELKKTLKSFVITVEEVVTTYNVVSRLGVEES